MQWTLDPTHSQVQFSVKHMGFSTVRGTFPKFSGTIDEDGGELKKVEVTIDTASVNTGADARDEHLRGADFFDSGNHPTATYTLTKFEQQGEDVVAHGDLTIRGVSKPVTLKGEISGPAKDPWGNPKMLATFATKISRKEWGLTWNAALETGGLLVSDDVKLEIEVQAVAKQD